MPIKWGLPFPSYSCGIDLGEHYVVTGGYTNIDTVALFSQTGFIKYLGRQTKEIKMGPFTFKKIKNDPFFYFVYFLRQLEGWKKIACLLQVYGWQWTDSNLKLMQLIKCFVLTLRTTKALLVTGGYQTGGHLYQSSTEIYSELTAKWSFAAPLPSARAGISAANLDNSVFVFGKNILSSSLKFFQFIIEYIFRPPETYYI